MSYIFQKGPESFSRKRFSRRRHGEFAFQCLFLVACRRLVVIVFAMVPAGTVCVPGLRKVRTVTRIYECRRLLMPELTIAEGMEGRSSWHSHSGCNCGDDMRISILA